MKKLSFEEVLAAYKLWDGTGTQSDFFKRHGWTRTAFFNESYKRQVDV